MRTLIGVFSKLADKGKFPVRLSVGIESASLLLDTPNASVMMQLLNKEDALAYETAKKGKFTEFRIWAAEDPRPKHVFH